MNTSYPALRVERMASVRSSVVVTTTGWSSALLRPTSRAVRDNMSPSLRAVGSIATSADTSAIAGAASVHSKGQTANHFDFNKMRASSNAQGHTTEPPRASERLIEGAESDSSQASQTTRLE